MKRFVLIKYGLLAATLAACVTINVYFPAAAAEKAADRIIGDVIGKAAGAATQDTSASPSGSDKPRDPGSASPDSSSNPAPRGTARIAVALDRVLRLVVAPAQAAAPDLDVSSAAIRQITDAMKSRHAQLAHYYDSGAIGYTADGMVEVRDANAIPLAERNSVRKSVADENRDRSSLYAEIAKANGHPEWAADIRATFAKRWVANAKPGWYYNDGSGWKQK
ncbi:MAG: YdbL family protein [Steroidobacteraceae bacterium]